MLDDNIGMYKYAYNLNVSPMSSINFLFKYFSFKII